MIGLLDLFDRLFGRAPCCIGEGGTIIRAGFPTPTESLLFRRGEMRLPGARAVRRSRGKTRIEAYAPCEGLHYYGMSLTK